MFNSNILLSIACILLNLYLFKSRFTKWLRTFHKLPDFLNDKAEVSITEIQKNIHSNACTGPLHTSWLHVHLTSYTINLIHVSFKWKKVVEFLCFFCKKNFKHYHAAAWRHVILLKKRIQRGSWFRSGARILKRCIKYAWSFLCMVWYNTKTF